MEQRVELRLHTSAYVSIRQRIEPTYVSIRLSRVELRVELRLEMGGAPLEFN